MFCAAVLSGWHWASGKAWPAVPSVCFGPESSSSLPPQTSSASAWHPSVLSQKLASKLHCHPERVLVRFRTKMSRRTCISGLRLMLGTSGTIHQCPESEVRIIMSGHPERVLVRFRTKMSRRTCICSSTNSRLTTVGPALDRGKSDLRMPQSPIGTAQQCWRRPLTATESLDPAPPRSNPPAAVPLL